MADFDPTNPGAYTVAEVKAHLDAHPEDTATVLAAEQARGGDARTTLINSLSAAPTEQAKPGEEGEAPAKPEDASISPPGEYPTEGVFGYAEPEK